MGNSTIFSRIGEKEVTRAIVAEFSRQFEEYVESDCVIIGAGPCAWGLQFHIEMTPDMVDSWLSEPGNCGELAQLDYIDPAAIRAATPREFPKMQQLGRRVLSRFAAMCARQAKA